MIKYAYYPGCTLKTTAASFEQSALAVGKAFGLQMQEIEGWTCCGTVYSIASDDIIHQLAPMRNIIRAQMQGFHNVVALCSMCYNTLASSNALMKSNPSKLETLNAYLERENGFNSGLTQPYKNDINVLHFLQLLKKEIGWDNVTKKVKKPLNGMKVSAYYGCTLVRPKEVAIDTIEEPKIMEDMLTALGAIPIDTTYKVECCGSYNTVNLKEAVIERTYNIIKTATRVGAEAIVLSCPLCDFNLDDRQKDTCEVHSDMPQIPIFYFTELLGLALGLDPKECGLTKHFVDPMPLLKKYKLI